MEWKQVLVSLILGVLIGITLDELFAGKVISAVKYELDLLHHKIDSFIAAVLTKLDAIFDKLDGKPKVNVSKVSDGNK